ncbi:AdoMet-dependent rRNA methyltransferase spb1 [Massospora cicadina]|nr:AdoMet-dependent rRNA methyltransferase spb1 [Massospora cicadina]
MLKIAEAKARKKYKAAQRLAKMQKKTSSIAESSDLTEREKAKTIDKMLSKSKSGKKNKNKVQLVVAKGPNKGTAGRPKGVKGRYKMVDARMKKELRAAKRKKKKKKRANCLRNASES